MGAITSFLEKKEFLIPKEFYFNFKDKSDKQYNHKNVIFTINNLPEIVFEKLSEKYACLNKNYQWIQIKKNIVIHNLDELDNSLQRFIFIKIELIDYNHVNCLIIDNRMKHIILFEPKGSEIIDINLLKSLVSLHGYIWITSKDMGFNMFNRIQYFDQFCQTYILMALICILNNPNTPVAEHASLFNDLINGYSINNFHKYISDKVKIENLNKNIIDMDKSKIKLNEIGEDDYIVVF